MAVEIPNLPEETTPTTSDLLIIEDVSTSTTKRTTVDKIVPAGSVTNTKLSTTTGEVGGAWASWTPTWSGVTVGNGTVVARYTTIGKTILFNLHFTLGSTSAITGEPRFSTPVAASTNNNFAQSTRDMNAFIEDVGSSSYFGRAGLFDANTIRVVVLNAAGTYLTNTGISSTIPMTWTTTDVLDVRGFYQAA